MNFNEDKLLKLNGRMEQTLPPYQEGLEEAAVVNNQSNQQN